MIKRLIALLVVLAASLALVPAAATDACTDTDPGTHPTEPVLGLEGLFALPASDPSALVVFAHGYRNRSTSWVPHLEEAAEHGVVAVAMDYRGTGPAPDNRGWPARAGAEDLIVAAQTFAAACGLLDAPIAILGVSMGANMSGLAVAAGATRAGGAPLFDHWIAVEGAVNAPETYLAARAAAASSPYVEGARDDLEAECGGPIEAEPACFRDLSIVARTTDVAAAGLRDVVLVHGLADGLVPYDQSRELATTLRAAGVTTEMITVLRRNDWQNPDSAEDEGGTTIDSYASPATGPAGADLRPLAGHGWEGSTTHIVIRTGLDRLWSLLDGQMPESAEYIADPETGLRRAV